jgi:predicted ATPase
LPPKSPSTGAAPAVLKAAVTVRLDRRGVAAREVAQIGAVLGREFSHELIRRVARRPDLDAALGQLTATGLLFRRGIGPRSSYLFKHALVQDAIYATLLHRRRQELHARVASALEQHLPDLVERQPELLARHLSAAGTPGPAIEYWLRAGERARKRSADREAIAQLRTALRLTEELPDSFERTAWELRISIALGPALMTTTSSAEPEVARVYARARQLAEESGRTVRLFQALWSSWLASFSAGDLRTTGGLVDELFALAREQHSPELMLQAHHAAWTTAALLQGDLRAAQRSLE